MLRGNHHHGGHAGFKLLNAILPFKRRKGAASEGAAAAAGATSVRWDQTFWGRRFLKSTTLMLTALLCSASIVMADIKISTKSSAGGRSLTGTTYIKGSRQRTEGMGYTTIYQCDQKRTIYLNDKTKTYFIAPLEAGGASGSSSSGQAQRTTGAKRKGGVVTYTTTNTDTGERREMMGMTARHLKSRIVIEASEGACNSMDMEMETDGWYIDLSEGLSCATDGSSVPNFGADQSDCVDEVRFKSVGTVKLGYPVQTTTRMKFNTGAGGADEVAANIPESSSTQEVVEISKATLDAALFEIPQGYREVKTMQELGSPY